MFDFNWGVFWAILVAFAVVEIFRWCAGNVAMLWLLWKLKSVPKLQK